MVEGHGEGVEETEGKRVLVAVVERHSVTLLVIVALGVVLGQPVMLLLMLPLEEALTESVTDELPQIEAAEEGVTAAAKDATFEGLTL